MVHLSNISGPGDIGPVSFQDLVTEIIKLALVDNVEAGSLKTKVKPPDAREERGESELPCFWPAVLTHVIPHGPTLGQ